MIQPRRISFVLPVHNEKDSVGLLHAKITAVMSTLPDDYEMLFIDDGSTDGSFEVLRAIQERDERVRVIQFRRNFGKAAAYSAGFDAASGDVVITMDTDLQDDPAEIELFLQKIDEGFDLVIGWKHEGKGPLSKSLPSKFFNRVVRRLTHIPLHDFNCPFKAYRREVLQEIEVYGELHRYIPVLARARGFTMTEVPIQNLPRRFGRSSYGIERYFRGMLDLLTVIFITRFAKRPSHLLAVGGIFAGAFGAALLVFLSVAGILEELGSVSSRWQFRDRPALSLGILLVIVGIQFLVSGLLGELFVIGSAYRGRDRGYSIKRQLGPGRSEPAPTPDE